MTSVFWHFGQQATWSKLPPVCIDLPGSGAHIWFFAEALHFAYEDLVSAAELERAADMLPRARAREFLSYRACLRNLLTHCYIRTLPAREIRIEIAEGGKPWLPETPSLRFNLSHSDGALAIAVSRYEVGIDIEKIRLIPDWRDLAENVLTPTDAATIASHAKAERSTAFLRCFTAREAYLKAIGTGLATARLQPDGADQQLLPLPPLPGFVGHACVLTTG